MSENKINEQINNMKNFQENMKKASEETADVKDGVTTPEEEQQEPSYVLFNAITENCIQTLQLESVAASMNKIGDKLGDDLTAELCTVMAVLMSQTAFNAVMFYDDILNKSLDEKFKEYDTIINDVSATTKGINGAMEVFKTRIGEIQKKIGLDNTKKN